MGVSLTTAQRAAIAKIVSAHQRELFDALTIANRKMEVALGITPAGPTTPAVARKLIAHIGDSLSADDEFMAPNAKAFITAKYQSITGFQAVEHYAVYGKYINEPAPHNDPYTTVQNIRNIRAKGAEPDVWVIALGTNIQSAGNPPSADFAAMDQVLTELGPAANVVAVGMCASGSRGNATHLAINDGWRTRMAARGAKGHFADYMAELNTKAGMDWSGTSYFRDGTHLTAAGYDHKYTWLANSVDVWLDTTNPGASTPTTPGGSTLPAATSGYATAMAALAPVLYLPMQDEYTVAANQTNLDKVQIKASDGTIFLPHGTYYPDDTRVYDKGPAAVGKMANQSIKNGVADSGISLAPKLAQLSTMAKANRWAFTAWIRTDEANYKQTILAMHSAAGHMSLHVANDGGGIRFEWGGGEILASAPTIVGRWVMVGMSFNSGAVSLYLDGKKVASGTAPAWNADLTQAWALSYKGTGAEANCFTGCVRQFSIIGKAMSDTEHTALHSTATASIYEVPWYGKSANYGGNAAWFTNAREAELAKPTTPLSGNWHASFPTGNAAQIAAEAKSYKLAIHANPWNLISDWQPTGQLVLPNYEQMVQAVADREFNTAKANGEFWVTEPMRQFSDKATTANVPGWTLSDEWDMGSLKDPEKATWADKAAKQDHDLNTYLPTGLRAYINQGTGATIGTNDRFQERKFFRNRRLLMTGADLYVQCVNKKVAQDAANGGYPSNDPAVIRRPIFYEWIQERVRGALDFNMPVIAAVGIGHANQPGVFGDWASVPTPNEVEADCIASFIGGATGVMWFPQSFEHEFDAQSPAWSASTAYKYGDQVRADTDGMTTYWACIAPSAAGIDPRTDTPNVRWVRWRVTQRSFASDAVGHAIGMPTAVQRIGQLMVKRAKVLQANNRRKVNVNDKLTALLVEAVDGRTHLLVMQKWNSTAGTYTLQLPQSAAGKAVTVEHQTGTDATATRTASATATFSETFADPASYRWYSWAE